MSTKASTAVLVLVTTVTTRLAQATVRLVPEPNSAAVAPTSAQYGTSARNGGQVGLSAGAALPPSSPRTLQTADQSVSRLLLSGLGPGTSFVAKTSSDQPLGPFMGAERHAGRGQHAGAQERHGVVRTDDEEEDNRCHSG